MIRPSRAVVAVLCLVVGVGAGAAHATTRQPASVSPDSTVPERPANDGVLELVDQLAPAGIEVVADPGAEPLVAVVEPRSPMRLLVDQVAAMELGLRDGTGVSIEELDAAVGVASDADDGAGAGEVVAATPSGVIIAWMDMGGTPASMLAAQLVGGGDESVADLGLHVLPQIVLVLFASDMAILGAALPEPSEQQPSGWAPSSPAFGEPLAPAQAGLCSSVIGFVNGVIASVFNAIGHLRNPPLVNTGFSPFDWFVNGVGKAVVGGVNAVIDGANFVIGNTVRIAIGTVMSFVGRIAGVVGTVAVVVSAIRPWTLKVEADPANVEAPGGGTIRATVDLGGFDEWPPPVADCAAAAGVPLPPLRPSGNPITWSVPGTGLIATDSADPRLRADGSALYTYHVIKEPPLPDGPNVVDEVSVRATVQRDDFRRLEEQLTELIQRQLAQLLPPVGSVVSPLVMPLVKPWIDRAFTALSHLRDVYGTTRLAVRYPDPNPPPTTAPIAVGTPYTMIWLPAVPQAPPVLAGYTCNGPGGTWRMVVVPALAPDQQQVTTLTFTEDPTGGAQRATWNVTVNAHGTSPEGDAIDITNVFAFVFTVRQAGGAPPTMEIGGTQVYTMQDTPPYGAPPFVDGPTTADASRLAGGTTPTLVEGLPDDALRDHPEWQHPLRTESRTAC